MPEIPFGATLKVFNAKVAYSRLQGSTSCRVCRQELDEVAYGLREPGQERDGVHSPHLTCRVLAEALALTDVAAHDEGQVVASQGQAHPEIVSCTTEKCSVF